MTFFLQSAEAATVNYGHLFRRWNRLLHGSNSTNQLQNLGVINGGGGSGMECTDSNGQTTVRLLDMKELSDVWNLTEIPFTGTDEEAMDLYAEKIISHNWAPWWGDPSGTKATIAAIVREVLAGAKFLKPGQDLAPVDDVHTPIHDPNCKLVQIAMLYDESQLLIDTDLWNQLSALDRAALIGHELVYAEARLNGEVDSVNARKFISYLFSTRGLVPNYDGASADGRDLVDCEATTMGGAVPKASLVGFEVPQSDGTNKTNFVFSNLDGKSPLFRTGFTTSMSLAEWKNGSGGEVMVGYDLAIDTFPRLRNQIVLSEKPGKGGVVRELTYFNENGTLLGGPWPLECY